MKHIKIIKRRKSETVEPPPIAEPTLTPDALKLRRAAANAINDWINNWRGRKQTDARRF